MSWRSTMCAYVIPAAVIPSEARDLVEIPRRGEAAPRDDENACAFSSLHQRHAEVGARLDALAPARGHGLHARVEAYALGTVLVHVAEDRVLPAPERVERQGHRDRHVDPDHAAVHLVGEVARDVAVAGED